MDLLKECEGCRLKAYRDCVGIYTIGYGFTTLDGVKVQAGDIITQQQADEQLEKQVCTFYHAVETSLKVEQTEQQKSALTVLAYNIGISNFKRSTLLKVINSNGSKDSIIYQWKRWDMAGGKHIKGLQNRRQKEINLYFKDNG